MLTEGVEEGGELEEEGELEESVVVEGVSETVAMIGVVAGDGVVLSRGSVGLDSDVEEGVSEDGEEDVLVEEEERGSWRGDP